MSDQFRHNNHPKVMYKRPIYTVLAERILDPRRFIQVLSGPRQVGKTTLISQALEAYPHGSHYASADEPSLKDAIWIEQQWETARLRSETSGWDSNFLLVFDEIQKIAGWSEVVKRFWDEDTKKKLPIVLIVLGSSQLLLQKGLTESLAGRFETIQLTHWSFKEMRDAFGFSLEDYVFYGGYPGAASLIADHSRWRNYLMNSLIETTVSRDILLMTRVDKPALLRRLFELGAVYSGQVLSYQKMVGQLQDAGNTTTLAHYLTLLEHAGLLAGIPKYAGQKVRQRASSPKLQVLNTALMSVFSNMQLKEARSNSDYWGRLVESAIGATLFNGCYQDGLELFYWRKGNKEVDFVLKKGELVTAIEVKSGYRKMNLPGLKAFTDEFGSPRKILAGSGGIPLEEFLQTPVSNWVS